MLEIIEEECSTQTVIAVVHRLRYIEWFDRVAFLQHGRLVEFDAPDTLLARESHFRELYLAMQGKMTERMGNWYLNSCFSLIPDDC